MERKQKQTYEVVLHFRWQEDTIYTDAKIVRELLESGIEKNDIILAYNPLPYQRLDNLIAI